VMGFEGDM